MSARDIFRGNRRSHIRGNALSDNLVIVVGVSLPLLLVLFFVLARGLPASRVADPRHDLIFASNYYDHQTNSLEFSVVEGQLKVRYFPESFGDQGRALVRPRPQLHYFDVSRRAVRDIPVELPVDGEGRLAERIQYIDVPALDGLQLDPGNTAPDGYRFEAMRRQGRGLFTELLVGGGSYRNGPVLEKEGRRIEIPTDAPYYSSRAIGWVVEDGGGKTRREGE